MHPTRCHALLQVSGHAGPTSLGDITEQCVLDVDTRLTFPPFAAEYYFGSRLGGAHTVNHYPYRSTSYNTEASHVTPGKLHAE